MDIKFSLKIKNLKDVTLFNPEPSPDKSSSDDGSILIELGNNKLTYKIPSYRYLLIGSDMVDISNNASITLSLKKIKDVVNKYSEDSDITFKVKDDNVSVEVNSIKYKFKSIKDEVEQIIDGLDKEEKVEEYTISKDKFTRGLNKLKNVMANDSTRYYLNGMYVEILYNKNENLSDAFFVATNGSTLGTFGNKKETYSVVEKAIIPRKVVPELIKVVEKSDNNVKVSIQKGKMFIKSDNGKLEMLLRLIEAEFPDYSRVIPQSNSNYIKLDNPLFKDMLSKVSIVNSIGGEIELSTSNNILSLKVSGDSGDLATTDINLAECNNDLQTKLNIDYISNIISQFDNKNLLIKFNDGNTPLIIEQDVDKELFFVLMPIRT